MKQLIENLRTSVCVVWWVLIMRMVILTIYLVPSWEKTQRLHEQFVKNQCIQTIESFWQSDTIFPPDFCKWNMKCMATLSLYWEDWDINNFCEDIIQAAF